MQDNPATENNGLVADSDQRIHVSVSGALSNPEHPSVADPTCEIPNFEIAMLEFGSSGTAVVVTGDMADLNATPGTADRRAYIRVRAAFEYDDSVEAALGPFAHIDEVTVSYETNS